MATQSLPFLLLGAAAVAAGVVAYTRSAKAAEEEEPTGKPYNFLSATTGAEYEQVIQTLQQSPKPIVSIVIRPGQVPFDAIQSAAMAQARAYPQIWVLLLLQSAVEAAGKQGIPGHCPADQGGVILAMPSGGAPIYEVCWPVGADPDLVKQNINIAAVNAKNLAAQNGAVSNPHGWYGIA